MVPEYRAGLSGSKCRICILARDLLSKFAASNTEGSVRRGNRYMAHAIRSKKSRNFTPKNSPVRPALELVTHHLPTLPEGRTGVSSLEILTYRRKRPPPGPSTAARSTR